MDSIQCFTTYLTRVRKHLGMRIAANKDMCESWRMFVVLEHSSVL